MPGRWLYITQLVLAIVLLPHDTAFGEADKTFTAPPRSVSDIETILDGQKPDYARIEKLKADATAAPLSDAAPEVQVNQYRLRAFALSELGRYAEATSFLDRGIAVGEQHNVDVVRLRLELGYLYSFAGDNLAALRSFERALEDIKRLKKNLFLLNCLRWLSQVHIYLGDVSRAEEYVRQLDLVIETYRRSPQYNETAYDAGRTQVEFAHARLFDARGQYLEAERRYELALSLTPALRRFAVGNSNSTDAGTGYLDTMTDNLIASAGRAKARQGRFAEGEVDARRALLGRLSSVGKYNLTTARTLPYLSTILVERGRLGEAERLTRVAIDIYQTLGVDDGSLAYASNLAELGAILCLQEKWEEASGVYAQLDHVVGNWDAVRRADLLFTPARIYMLYNTNRLEAGLADASSMVHRLSERVGETRFEYALGQGILAIGLVKAGRNSEAVQEFRSAVPVLLRTLGESSNQEGSQAAARQQYTRKIVEAYLGELARGGKAGGNSQAIAAETLRLADAIRSQSVQRALYQSSARVALRDPELAELARKEQDLSKQVGAQLDLLTNILAMPPEEREKRGVREVETSIERLRVERDRTRTEINSRFPSYGDLIDPKPPTIEDIKMSLVDGECLLSFYFGRDQSFVWAVPKQGSVVFDSIPMTAAQFDDKVRRLRESLDPQVDSVDEIPAFDVGLAHELYGLLLKPVEAIWKPSKSLVVVTNGALGLLPISLLPTAPAEIKANGPLFSGYREVPWLARTHAVTMVPSAAALRTLRELPPGKSGRTALIGFGDPLFSSDEAAQAASEIKLADASTNATRGALLKRRSTPKLEGVASAELALLPRLPDTAEELRSIALALHTDPSKVLKLGRDANEETVKKMDLSAVKIIAFATHGLVPGDLNGLTQPALALTAPSVAGVDGDGLLTMDEILALKLDADWVVLSACNTAAGEGAGAEAASGLGRAFFYAGTRAVLVTNWSVHSISAKELMTDLFRRQADGAELTRAEALRQAMMALMDGPGYVGSDGQTEFSYAHPLFWAPYSIIGDGRAP